MKKLFYAASITIVSLGACNNSGTDKKEEKKTDVTQLRSADSTANQSTENSNPASKADISLNQILSSYMQMKNAFAKDNDKDAATAGEVMVKAFAGFNKAGLHAEQSKLYDDLEGDAKEHAEHISVNKGNIKHQREHFDMLSKDIYQLVKTFGAGYIVYYDHCPMYNNGKGASWLSESKEIHNPYLGRSMPTCGSVKEELK
ncbi:MAG: DUF3347 domain-containing protein [Ferruginibacter sp.]